MKIEQSFLVAQPLSAVWDFFKDVPKVAECLPGAEYLGTKEDGSLAGKVSAKVGPFQASFEGEAKVVYDDVGNSIEFDGKGVDRKGASRGKMTMKCHLVPEGQATRVGVDADVQLSGSIAQFGRTGLLTEIANHLVADFVRNAEAELGKAVPVAPSTTASDAAGAAPQAAFSQAASPQATPARATPAGKPLSATALLAAVIKGWFRSLFRRSA